MKKPIFPLALHRETLRQLTSQELRHLVQGRGGSQVASERADNLGGSICSHVPMSGFC